jgi:hypothetical protein
MGPGVTGGGRVNAPGTRECHCGDPITPCYAEIIWGHRNPTGCRGWVHDGGEHACPDGTFAWPAVDDPATIDGEFTRLGVPEDERPEYTYLLTQDGGNLLELLDGCPDRLALDRLANT